MKRMYYPGALSAALPLLFAHLKSERIINKTLRLLFLMQRLSFYVFIHFALMQNEPKNQDLKLLHYKLRPC